MIEKNFYSFSRNLFLALCFICTISIFPAKIQAQNNTLQENNLQSSLKTEKTSSLTVERAALATSIIDREPQGEANTFSFDIEKIYFFTHVKGALDPTVIYHRWYYKNNLMAEVELPIKSNSWRTYSSKRIIYEWVGNWSVEAVDSEGNVLKTLTFEIL